MGAFSFFLKPPLNGRWGKKWEEAASSFGLKEEVLKNLQGLF